MSEPRKSLGREFAAITQRDRLIHLALGFILLPLLGLGVVFFLRWHKKRSEVECFLRNAREGRVRVQVLEYLPLSANASSKKGKEGSGFSIQYSVIGEPIELRMELRGEAAFKHARNIEAILRKNFREMEVVGMI